MNATQYDIVKTFLPFGGALKLAKSFKIPLSEVRRVEQTSSYAQYLENPKADLSPEDFIKMFGGTI